MARNGDGKMVRGASSCHGTGGFRCADALRDLSIGHRRADRDLLERLPHASLESSAANIEGKLHADPPTGNHHGRSRFPPICADALLRRGNGVAIEYLGGPAR